MATPYSYIHAIPLMLRARCGAIAIAVTALLNVSTSAHAEATSRFQSECERRLPATSIEVLAHPSDVQYDFTQSVASLTKRRTLPATGKVTLGLTEAALRLEVKWSGDSLVDTMTRLSCTRPKLVLSLSVGPQRVFVGNEFPQDSCSFWEIAQHELRHVRANQDQLETVVDNLRQALQKSFGNRVFYGTAAELKTAFTEHLRETWLPYAKDSFARVERAHNEIDSPEEYARNNTMCNAEVPRLLQRK